MHFPEAAHTDTDHGHKSKSGHPLFFLFETSHMPQRLNDNVDTYETVQGVVRAQGSSFLSSTPYLSLTLTQNTLVYQSFAFCDSS